MIARVVTTASGTTKATNEGLMVCAKKNSIFSMSLPTMLTISPERRFTIYAGARGSILVYMSIRISARRR